MQANQATDMVIMLLLLGGSVNNEPKSQNDVGGNKPLSSLNRSIDSKQSRPTRSKAQNTTSIAGKPSMHEKTSVYGKDAIRPKVVLPHAPTDNPYDKDAIFKLINQDVAQNILTQMNKVTSDTVSTI